MMASHIGWEMIEKSLKKVLIILVNGLLAKKMKKDKKLLTHTKTPGIQYA